MYAAKPTREQLIWQDMELGVLIHYVMEIYNPEFKAYKTNAVRTELNPAIIRPTKLDPEQWVRSAWEMGAKYAVLVANHCTGFSLWPTKANDYSTASLAWKDGKGDIVGDFIKACRKYGLKPGLYYSTGCNGYYNINDDWKWDYKSDEYQAYVKVVESQVEELWSQYGELFEVWFDGGIIPLEQGGPNLVPLLEKYQPQALCFQGPKGFPHNLRWVGTEAGLAPANCWATTNAGEARFDGTVPNEKAGVGDPNGKYYWPAETDTPNRAQNAFGGGWGWKAGEEDKVRSVEELLECYINSVGRNSNLLLGMAISTDGDFQDEEQFRQFGELLRETFGTPVVRLVNTSESVIDLVIPEGKSGKYLVMRENIAEGQLIRGYTVSVNGQEFYTGECIGHKRILKLEGVSGTVSVKITEAMDGWSMRDIEIY